MGRLFLINLEGNIYSCKYCHTPLALLDDIISKESNLHSLDRLKTYLKTYKSFNCRHGKAYLFNDVVNVTVGEREERLMITGLHTVVDIFCVKCGSNVGWKYEVAHEKSEKYKEGKSILERFKVVGPDGSGYLPVQEAHIAGSDGDEA